MTAVYAAHAADYRLAGWQGVLPVPPQTKTPPPEGYTGAHGRDPEAIDIVRWAGTLGGHSIALRMPEGVVGIDVDQYEKSGKAKQGARTLAHFEGLWGALPPTWSSTARGPGQSRILLYRAPAQRYTTALLATLPDGAMSGDVEIIQRHHRYAVVAPSLHPEAGAPYAWYRPDGTPAQPAEVPRPGDLAELPPAWVTGLAAGASAASPLAASEAAGAAMLEQLMADDRPECVELANVRHCAESRIREAEAGSRHDVVTGQVYAAVMTGAAGHPGAGGLITLLRELWAGLTPGEDRSEEIERMLRTAARKAATATGARQVATDPCLLMQGTVGAAPAAEAAGVEPLAEPETSYPYQVIGAAPFDPQHVLDQPLAAASLARLYPYCRWAYDARVWLLRRATRWEVHKSPRGSDIAQHGAALLAQLMPRGDASAEKGSPEQLRAARYARYHSTAGARAVAGKMMDLVAGGTHPCSLRLGDLDADPEIMWAGGAPYDLRRAVRGTSASEWVAAQQVDAPHVHTAAVAPAAGPTPRWDAFLAAVFPDPEVRAWTLRVLAVALTGYSDRVLPILYGESARGKTQLLVLLMSLLGSYAHAADPKLLSTAAEHAATGAVVYALRGRRLSFIDEGPREGRFAQERLKQLTGGGELTADDKYQSPVTWRPTHTLVLTANEPPSVVDPAVRARTRVIPCQGDPDAVYAARAAIGPTSSPAWRAEAPAVLYALMCEAGAYLRDPGSASQQQAPASIRDLAEEMARDQDPVLRWLAEETEPASPGTAATLLYQQFVASCRQANLRSDAIPPLQTWGRALTQLGYPPLRDKTARYRGLRARQGGIGDGLAPVGGDLVTVGDGTVTVYDDIPSSIKPLVGTEILRSGDGMTVLDPDLRAHTRAHAGASRAHAHVSAIPENTVIPSPERKISVPTRGFIDDGMPSNTVTIPSPAPSPHPRIPPGGTHGDCKTPSEGINAGYARQKRTEKLAAARAAAVAQAEGEQYVLPVVVTRDSVTELGAAQAGELLATLPALTVDVETSGYPVGHRHFALRTVQLGGESFAVVFDPQDASQRAVIEAALRGAEQLHAHSATADLVPLAEAGLLDAEDAWARMYDTVIPAKLADPASTGADPGLKRLASAVLGDRATTPQADAGRAGLFRAGRWLTDVRPGTPPVRSGWAQVSSTSAVMVRYAASDVLDTAALAARLPVIPPTLLARERDVQRVTARVAHTGLRIDGAHTERLLAEHTGAAESAAARVRAAGVVSPGSNPQIAAVLADMGVVLPRTTTGRSSVRSDVLERLAATEGVPGAFARDVLDYRGHTKLINTYLEPYLEQVHYGDGRIRPTIYTLAADTGRMACVRPNVQQLPRSGGIRACVTADPGDLLISADFAGVELRVAAALSQDATLTAIMADPERDLHWEVARLAFGADATKTQRYAAKRGVFGRIYGAGVGTIASSVGVSVDVAQQIVAALDQLTPGLSAWSAGIREQVRAGHTTYQTYAGRVIHLDAEQPHKAPNYCIQGTARELLVDAILAFAGTRWGGCVLVPVHDEIVACVPADEAGAATAALADAMRTTLYGVPIIPETAEPSYSWRDSA